jgi:uncharacterized protein (TIGR02145 family)
MNSRSRFLYIIFIIFVFFILSCDNGKDTVSPDDTEVVISENVIIPEDDPDITVETIEEDHLTFNFTGDAPDIIENDILVGTAEGGYLRKVTSVSVTGNTMEVQTIQASLVEAIERGTMDTTLSLDFGSSNRALYGLETKYLHDGVTVRDNGINISGTELFSGNINGTNVLLTLPTGEITFTPDLDIGFDIDGGQVQEFHAIASGALDFNFDIRGEFSGILMDFNNNNDPIVLASFSNTFVQMVGFVPVVEVVTLKFEAGYAVNIGYSGEVQAGFDSNLSVSVGAQYYEANFPQWSEIWIPEYDFNIHQPEWNAEGQVSIRGYVRPTLDIKLYAIAGPYLDIEPFLRYEGNIQTDPQEWSWALYGGAESTLGFVIELMDWQLADFNMELLDPPYEETIDSDSGVIIVNNPPTISSLIANPVEIGVNGNSSITCSATDSDFDILTYSWTTTGGYIGGEGSNVIYNAPNTPGNYVITCIVSDGNGGTAIETVSVIVNGPPGMVTTIYPQDGLENLPNEIVFSWYPTIDADNYDLQISTNPYFPSPYDFDIVGIDTTFYSVNNLNFSTMYYWRVRATNEYYIGVFSTILSSFTTGTPPDSPTLVVPVNNAVGQPLTLTLEWGSVIDATGYYYAVSTDIDFQNNLYSGITELTTLAIDELSNTITYFWRVSSYNDFGISEWSDVWQFTTVDFNQSPDVPSEPSPTHTSEDVSVNAELLWNCTDPDSDPLTFDVYFGLTADPPLVDSGISNLSYNPGPMDYLTTYYWKIRAYDDYGNWTVGYTWQFTTESSEGSSTCTDYDGNVYETVTIGDQEWMAENLKVTHYRNGDPLLTGVSNPDWRYCPTGAYAIYNNDPINGEIYGYLYNWRAVDDSRNIAPEGWHVPSDAEWNILVEFLGSDAGGKLKEAGYDHWNPPNTGATNESGFTALASGNRSYYHGGFRELGNSEFYWTSTYSGWGGSYYEAWVHYVQYGTSYTQRIDLPIGAGISIRCVKD